MKINFLAFSYFGLVLLVWLIQIVLTYQTRFLYHFEDGGQYATAVIWFVNHEISVISSTAFSLYALFHIIYSLFGFSLDTPHYFRIILHLFTLLSLGIILKRYFGYLKSIIPLITIGLSPTFTYFVTYSAQYGLELQLFPICLVLVDSLNYEKKIKAVILETGVWFIAMFGLLSYAPFTFFLPALAIIMLIRGWWLFKKKMWKEIVFHSLISLLAFLAPLIAGLFYFKDSQNVFYDPDIPLGGLFRAGSYFIFNDITLFSAIHNTLRDLFDNGYSYYYQLHNGEFSYFLPIFPVILVICFGIFFPKRYRLFKLIIWVTILSNVFIASFGYDQSRLPGVRRYTPTLAAFYALFSLTWYISLSYVKKQQRLVKYLIIGILLILPFHHILVLPDNFRHLPDPPILWTYDKHFLLYGNPQNYFKAKLTILVKSDLYLDCREAYGAATDECSYQNIFATLKAYCLYNKLSCHKIYGWDPTTQTNLLLTVESLNKESAHLR